MFDRYEALQKAIADQSLDHNTLMLMVDFYLEKGKLSQEQHDALMVLLNPPESEPQEPEE